MDGHTNNAYSDDHGRPTFKQPPVHIQTQDTLEIKEKDTNRDTWGNQWEFLMSCIALSVGLGNVWRFPFTALENGGGAFLIPYLIVLLLVGKPVYYMEMLIGQFSSRGSIKVFDISPAMRGVGYGQVLSTLLVTTYYAGIMALTLRYFFASFSAELPWSRCRDEWESNCVDAHALNISALSNSSQKFSTSAELYFVKEILKETNTIHNGIGYPDWKLVLCLALSWTIISLILVKGVKSSGKASYFLAIFPYIVMVILLIRAVTLPGAANGIIYFIKPQWNMLLSPQVWYAAVTQVFFSLAICFGNIIMYASYNQFGHNIRRDVIIVTTLDTFTSLLAGCIIFGILGNLAYETDTDDIRKVVQGGASLAFVSYPEALSKFQFVPQLFSVLFFLMLFVLGIGSNIGMSSVAMTVIRDKFGMLKKWKIAIGIGVVQFALGCIYMTPGGQYILNLVDFFGASFVAFWMGIAELVTVGWIYGVKRLCKDVEFMLGIKTGLYWRLCWGIITPALMIFILIYTIVEYQPLKYRDYIYHDGAYVFGWGLSAIGILQLPLWCGYAVYKAKGNTLMDKIKTAFKPSRNWGPTDPVMYLKYSQFIEESDSKISQRKGFLNKFLDNIFG